MAKTNLSVLSNRAGDTESLKTDTDSSSSVSCLGAARLDCDSCAYNICPLSVFEADGLCFFNDLIRVDTVSIADILTLVDRLNTIFVKSREGFRLTSLVTFKFSHYTLPP